MEIKRSIVPVFLTGFILSACFIVLSGCSTNIKHIPASTEMTSNNKVFNHSFENVWTATSRALSEEETFKVIDKGGGIIVTDFRTVDGNELSVISTTFLGKTYKYSYNINFDKVSPGKTRVTVFVKLQNVMVGFFSRETKLDNVENYLRQKLIEKIIKRLGS